MIKVHNRGYGTGEARYIPLSEVNIHTQKICEFTGAPYIIFEHEDYPLGSLSATFDGTYWDCDLD
jgi:hypothetical protein